MPCKDSKKRFLNWFFHYVVIWHFKLIFYSSEHFSYFSAYILLNCWSYLVITKNALSNSNNFIRYRHILRHFTISLISSIDWTKLKLFILATSFRQNLFSEPWRYLITKQNLLTLHMILHLLFFYISFVFVYQILLGKVLVIHVLCLYRLITV